MQQMLSTGSSAASSVHSFSCLATSFYNLMPHLCHGLCKTLAWLLSSLTATLTYDKQNLLRCPGCSWEIKLGASIQGSAYEKSSFIIDHSSIHEFLTLLGLHNRFACQLPADNHCLSSQHATASLPHSSVRLPDLATPLTPLHPERLRNQCK